MGCTQDDVRRHARLQRFLPTRRAQAPSVTRAKSGKPELQPGGHKIVIAQPAVLQEIGCHASADYVRACVPWPGIAASISVKAGEGLLTAQLQRLTQYIS